MARQSTQAANNSNVTHNVYRQHEETLAIFVSTSVIDSDLAAPGNQSVIPSSHSTTSSNTSHLTLDSSPSSNHDSYAQKDQGTLTVRLGGTPRVANTSYLTPDSRTSSNRDSCIQGDVGAISNTKGTLCVASLSDGQSTCGSPSGAGSRASTLSTSSISFVNSRSNGQSQ